MVQKANQDLLIIWRKKKKGKLGSFARRFAAGAHLRSPRVLSLHFSPAIDPTTAWTAVSFPSTNTRYSLTTEWPGTATQHMPRRNSTVAIGHQPITGGAIETNHLAQGWTGVEIYETNFCPHQGSNTWPLGSQANALSIRPLRPLSLVSHAWNCWIPVKI